MPWETAKACIDYFYEHSVDADRVDLSFYGGEPFCNFDLIEKSTKYFDHLFCGKYKTYSMTINATLLNKKNLEFLDKFEFKLMISLDGNKKKMIKIENLIILIKVCTIILLRISKL